MKITISAAGDNMQAELDKRFGRCACFLVYDTETGKVETVRNPAGEAGGGAGVKAAQTVVGTGAEAVITGNIGPNALEVLQRARIKCFTADGGRVEQLVADYKEGSLHEIKAPTVAKHGGAGTRS